MNGTMEDTGIGVSDVARVLGSHPAAEAAYRRTLAREAYSRGHRDGYYAGYERAESDMAANWAAIAEPASHMHPTHAELETRRWGPLGRSHFADPRPGDRLGSAA